MSSLDTNTSQGQAENVQPGTQQAQAPLQPGQNPSMGNVPGLPPTALSMQMQSMNDQYQQAQQQAQMQTMGATLQTGGPLTMTNEQTGSQFGAGEFGRTSLQDMAERMARSYGLNFSRGSLVDSEGNFQMTPDQLASDGGEMDTIAAQMNRIAQAINDRQVEQQQNKATAALQAGLGQVQQRGRGSLAGMQSNFYQSMAQNYTDPNLLPEQQDFSFWIQKAGFEEAEEQRLKEESALGGSGNAGKPGYSSDGTPIVSNPTYGNSQGSSTTGPQGKGDVVTTGPNAGMRPVYTYDPINKTTTVSWEKA